MGVAYPRRDDGVRYEQFDGTLESVQRIVNLTGQEVTIRLEPRNNFLPGDVLRLSALNFMGGKVDIGDYVVKGKEVVWYPSDVFHTKFATKDGWGN
ncbi:hypothetical protein PBI_WHIRLWIND_69 [Mycobacterium phage Whirlwind]|uniref:Uncharacterized protein n=1 Tax=Mycobacterium phage Whirlwind TaxID=1340826 RepID=S5YAM0_9CAUD|nr:hypothetical protein N852_gp110 [Mycobacterium phage Whirlwind]AGT12675.1 hypothetical protein PBI_WHIRLWIND_69 [Mycobacterium phage Whirlwind]